MNTFNDITLESLLAAPALRTPPTSQPRHALTRTLLVSAGAQARIVCRRAWEIAADWLNTTPPLAHWDAGTLAAAGTPEDTARVTVLLDGIAQRKGIQALHDAGYTVQNPEEIVLWMVLSDDGEGLPAPAALQTVSAWLHRLAWSRMRARATLSVMALVEPDNVSVMGRWRQQIASTTDALHLCSPVNLHHLRLDAADFCEHTAVALAVRVCGAFPSHTRPADASCLAVGAAQWTAPIAELRRGLALLSAQHAVAALRNELAAAIADANASSHHDLMIGRIATLEQSDLDLAAAVTPAAPAARWRQLGLGWSDLAELRTRVQERLDRRDARHEQMLRQARHAWLDQRIDQWRTQLEAVDRLLLPAGDGAPPLQQQRQHLHLLAARLRQDLDALTTALERSDQRLQAAEAQVDDAWEQVEKLCGQLPPATMKGVLIAAVQPWMWPVWPYALHVLLPQEGQKMLDAVAYRSKVRWHEANWHVLRQVTLAMHQDVNRRLHQLERLAAYVAALHADLTAQLAALVLPAPWSHAALHTLWEAAQAHTPPLAHFPQQATPATWPDTPLAECAAQLVASYHAATAFVEQWTVLDCLVQPFLPHDAAPADDDAHAAPTAPTAEAPLPPACLAWLTALADAALPLWPDPAPTPVVGPVGWCLLPPPVIGAAASGLGQDALQPWCETVVNLAPATLAGYTLAILRWAAVAGDSETADGEAVDGEAVDGETVDSTFQEAPATAGA